MGPRNQAEALHCTDFGGTHIRVVLRNTGCSSVDERKNT
jgi:hypothetical protein